MKHRSQSGPIAAAQWLTCSSLLAFAVAAGASQQSAAPATGTEQPQQQQSAALGGQQQPAAGDQEAEQAQQMIGRKLVDQQGKELGQVEKIVRDPQDQQLKAVVGTGGFLGIGEKQVVVPLNQLELQQPGQQQPQDQAMGGGQAGGMQQQQEQQSASGEQQRQEEPHVVIKADITPEALEQMASYDEDRYEDVPPLSQQQSGSSPQG